MRFIADFHIHSKFSRATAQNLDFEHLYLAAQQKGITVIGTGDCTHPAWFAEIKNKLVPAEPGLFKLRADLASECDKLIPPKCRGPVRYMLTAEISNIYKKDKKTRKNHNLVFLPDLPSAEQFNQRLAAIGNIASDGRPILGLDAKYLLEILLETSPEAFLVPAHIWTPWFSLLGSKSGFDSLAECFDELTPHIFAAETGLSSDPPMNWRVSGLDHLTLMSNSDAHSPGKLGREANLFDTELSFTDIRAALHSGDPARFLGTFEFYPEEGKYHLDGHRKCNVRLWPQETRQNEGLCPECGRPLTLGVLYRVEELADRPAGAQKANQHPFYSTLPLTEILAEIFQMGVQSQKVQAAYENVLEKLGPELTILHQVPLETIASADIPLLSEAIKRMREKNITMLPGFDGEFGRLKIFTDEERDRLRGLQSLFPMGLAEQPLFRELENQGKSKPAQADLSRHPQPKDQPKEELNQEKTKGAAFANLNGEQQRAVTYPAAPLLIVAGPGTGKTLTLTHRIAHLINQEGIAPGNMLAVTFTNKAAQEMSERLKILLGSAPSLPLTTTFHAFCFQMLGELESPAEYAIADDLEQLHLVNAALGLAQANFPEISAGPAEFLDMIVAAKQQLIAPHENLETIALGAGCKAEHLRVVYQTYQDLLTIQGRHDFDDLIFKVVRRLEEDESLRKHYQQRFPYIFIDEYQDLNHGQYRLVRALAPEQAAICVIGDPDQSIYGFRGSEVAYFNRFVGDYPRAEVIHLTKNYRSTETILEASHQLIRDQHVTVTGARTYSGIHGQKTISIIETASEKAEAVTIGKMIEQLVGGMGFHSMDFGKVEDWRASRELSFGDMAVLFRTNAQGLVFSEIFEKAGIPYQVVSKARSYSRRGIREILALYRILSDQGTYADLEQSLTALVDGIGKQTLDLLLAWCFQNKLPAAEALVNVGRFPIKGLRTQHQAKLAEFFQRLLDMKKLLKNQQAVDVLLYLKDQIKPIAAALEADPKAGEIFDRLLLRAERADSARDFLENLALQSDQDIYLSKSERVALMTLHAAKGLEFPVVFIAGCENGLVPYQRPGRRQDLAEEKRLFYVGMTRAKEQLILTYANMRRLFGETVPREPSAFISDIEKELIRREKAGRRKKSENPENKPQQVQLDLFS